VARMLWTRLAGRRWCLVEGVLLVCFRSLGAWTETIASTDEAIWPAALRDCGWSCCLLFPTNAQNIIHPDAQLNPSRALPHSDPLKPGLLSASLANRLTTNHRDGQIRILPPPPPVQALEVLQGVSQRTSRRKTEAKRWIGTGRSIRGLRTTDKEQSLRRYISLTRTHDHDALGCFV
jgi:hypothetical protein